jgi:hypothetical protein
MHTRLMTTVNVERMGIPSVQIAAMKILVNHIVLMAMKKLWVLGVVQHVGVAVTPFHVLKQSLKIVSGIGHTKAVAHLIVT